MTDRGIPIGSHTGLFYSGAADIGSALEVLRPSIGRSHEPLVLFGPSGVPRSARAAFDRHFKNELRGASADTTVRLVEGHRDPDEHVARLTRIIDELTQEGAQLVRVLGMVGWEAPGWPFPEDHIWAESRTNEAVGGFRAEVTCAYDVTTLPGPALIYGGIETHPVIRVNGTTITNDRVISPGSFVADRLPRLAWLSRRSAAVDRGIHACAFFTTRDEEYATLLPLMREGMSAGQSAVHIVDPDRREDHVRRVAEAGITTGSNELRVSAWPETYLAGGRFNADGMLATLRALLSGSTTGTHLIADMAWALQEAAGVDDLVEYEARINGSMPGPLDTVICTYDSARFAGPVLLDILRAHPVVILGGTLHANDLHVPSDTLIQELGRRPHADRASSPQDPLPAPPE